MACAVLVVDVQTALVRELETKRATRFLATLGALLERARASDVLVVYVRNDGSPSELIPGTSEWEIASEVAPRSGEAVADKRFRDAFRETELAERLAAAGVDRLVVCGMHSEFCVDATVREAERRGYDVTLVEDGHVTLPAGGLTEEQIRVHVNRVARGRVARVVPAAELFVGHEGERTGSNVAS